jgi:Mlc titration factor MtfA (ptsG expression regulator)
MIWGIFKQRRRKKLIQEPFPDAWRAILEQHVPMYGKLTPELRGRLEQSVQILIAEKHFEGCGGLELTDEIRVTIAGHAGCLLLGHDFDYFSRLVSILVYPSIFFVPGHAPELAGTISEEADEHLGESWDIGAVVLAWDQVLRGASNTDDGYNVVLHEFAHQLDAEVSGTDGWPSLRGAELLNRWSDVMQRNYLRLERDLRRGRRTVLDSYALENEAEFFAVATETFFEAGKMMKNRAPDLYGILRDFYGFDPVMAAVYRSSVR